MKKLTSVGELVKVMNTHELGIDLLTEVRRRKLEMDAIKYAKAMKKKQEHYNLVNEYVKLITDKPDESSWTIPDLKVALKAMKTDKDGMMLTRKQDIINMFESMKSRHADTIVWYNQMKPEFRDSRI